jgi:hypothetical protein
MMNRPLKIALAVLTIVLIAAGCSRDNPTAPAPAPSTNSGVALTPETQSGLVTMQSALESPAWQSLDALRLTSSPASSAAGSVRPMLMGAAATQSVVTAATSSLVRDVAERLRQLAATSPEAKVIPASVLGTTYVFDPLKHGYVADPSRTGAPANGVRYVLYAVNPSFTHEPVVSSEIGYADLTDEGNDTPNTATLRLVAVSDGVTFVDYRVSLAGENGSGELAVEGTFYDGTKHLAFVIHVLGEQTADGQILAVRFRLAVPEDNFALTNEARAVAKDGTTRLNQAIAVGDHRFVIASVHSPDEVDATVTVDGAVFAVIHWDASKLTVVGPTGERLPLEDRVALWRLLGLFDHVSRLLYRLLMPVNALFALIPQA